MTFMQAISYVIATSDPYHLLGIGYALGVLFASTALLLVRRPPVAGILDRLYRTSLRLPACGPDGCYCRRSCSWMIGLDPQEFRRG